ncbi:MAG: alkaline shock response membrane anchor protein AmaP [Candidatus Omnitrophica bacterium]|nr:alkaline shock response membrane anchor protein AmaP [Candidatus Omnitrophota bacterium]
MRVISTLTIILYSILFLIIGLCLIFIAFNLLSKDTIAYTVDFIYNTPNMRLVIGITGGLLVLVTLLVLQIIVGKMQMQRTIAFENPDGQVTISLGAIEDFIKRLARQLPEIKDLKPDVIATKKGVNITTRLVLFSDTNIPETTEKIQNLIKGKVQDILGIEESISVKIHISKIAQKEESKETKTRDKEPVSSYRGIEY